MSAVRFYQKQCFARIRTAIHISKREVLHMARLNLYNDNQMDSTIVPNLFIDNYMKNANDAQLKIYLYLLRKMNARQATSVSDIADMFNHTEKDVIRALKYWEQNQLIDLDFDSSGKELVGIHIRDLETCSAPGMTSDAQPAPSFVPAPVAAAEPEAEPVSPYAKPSYSASQLKEFKSRQNTVQLLGIAEAYIGKPLTPAEIKSILYFSDKLHFSDDLIDYLIQYCVDNGHKSFHYIEKVALDWANAGITTPEQAQKTSARYNKTVYTVMKELGKSGSPTNTEVEYITRWVNDYGFSTDIILEACRRTVLSTDKRRFEYAESILSSWKTQNVHQKSDIQQLDNNYRQRRKTAPAPAKQTANRFNQFPQNDYDFDALEKALLSN